MDPCYPRWAGFLHARWAGDTVGVSRVLDVACGTGLLAAELVALGYRVTGVDASAAMLDRARARLGPAADLRLAVLPELPDLADLPDVTGGGFDAAVSTFDGLNYLCPEDLRATLRAVGDLLRPRGWLVFDLHTDAMMRFTLDNPVVSGEADGSAFVITSSVDPRRRSCETRIEVRGGDEPFTERHRQFFHADADVRSALSRAGFALETVTDEYTDDPVDDATLRATWVARRLS